MTSTIQDKFTLRGKTALLTGASGKLGRHFAETLLGLGADLILVDRPSVEYKKFIGELENDNKSRVRAFQCDFEDPLDRKKLIQSLLAEISEINVLVNNAAFVGTSDLTGWATTFENQSIETWNRALEVNLSSVFEITQGVLPVLNKSSSVSIINIASIYGARSPDWTLYENTNLGNPAAYAVSKAGLIQLTKWLATSLGQNIRVNAVAPGGIFRNQPTLFVEKYSRETAMGRMATEDDLQGVLAFLATDLSNYMTGQVLFVDGGWKL